MTLSDDVGVVVRGGVDSVAFCLADGRRHNDGPVALLTDAGLIHVDPWHPWKLEEVRRVG